MLGFLLPIMHEYPIYNLRPELIPESLRHIPQPPKQIFIRGDFPVAENLVFLTVVGSRNPTRYGSDVCEHLIRGLRGYPIIIVSGLALGIDTIAHESAIAANLPTIAFPGSGLGEKNLHPANNIPLAQKILESNGCLISEYDEHEVSKMWMFPQRNRLMAGISRATLVIEATHKSGSRITTKLATDYNRDVLAVPGSIFSELSQGPNELIRMGAIPVTSSREILEALGFDLEPQPMLDLFSNASQNPNQEKVLKLLNSPKSRGDLIRELGLPTAQANVLISEMEMLGMIKDMGGELRRA